MRQRSSVSRIAASAALATLVASATGSSVLGQSEDIQLWRIFNECASQ